MTGMACTTAPEYMGWLDDPQRPSLTKRRSPRHSTTSSSSSPAKSNLIKVHIHHQSLNSPPTSPFSSHSSDLILPHPPCPIETSIHNLLALWTLLLDFLTYRHILSYYLHLPLWRRRIFTPTSLAFPRFSDDPRSLRLEALTAILLLHPTDSAFYALQCFSFRAEQRRRRVAFKRRLAELMSVYRRRRGVVRWASMWARVQGAFLVEDWFELGVELGERHVEAEKRFGREVG